MAQRLATCLRRKATQFLTEPPCRRVFEGKRLLAVCRAVLERILALAMAARLGDDPAFARRAIDEMMAAAAFSDWNPTHFLETAEMTFALAVGYDWLYDLLTDDERETNRRRYYREGPHSLPRYRQQELLVDHRRQTTGRRYVTRAWSSARWHWPSTTLRWPPT